MSAAKGQRPPLTPRYWAAWLGVAVLWLLGRMPQRLALMLARPLGWVMSVAMVRRRRVAERNLERCFPEADRDGQKALIGECFRSLGRTLFEIAWSWSGSDSFLRRLGGVDGIEHVQECVGRGQGVLLVTAHFTCLEIGARLAALRFDRAGAIYRPLRSPVLEWYQNRSRGRYTDALIVKQDMRAAVRFLRSGGVLWYAPDQDFGPKRSVFAPFFGIPAATLVATERLAQLTGCAVIPMFPRYDRQSRKYVVTLYPRLEGFPTGDPVTDLARINALLEQHVRMAPEQYWWIHRRFKTRPEGEPPFYD